jgi:hypothetical protein
MMSDRVVALAAFLLLSFLALPAIAQDGKAQDQSSGTSVVVLQFETFNVDQEIMDDFYLALHDEIEAHEEMRVQAGGDVSISDLTLTLGCDEANAECLAGLSDFVEGDRIVFGSVQHSEGVYLFTLKMFDFSEKAFVHEVVDETLEASGEQIDAGVTAIIEGFLYGEVGVLEVAVNGATLPEVYFNGERLGRAPLTIEGLPLGEHAVTVRTDGGEEQSKKVMLRRESMSRVQFEFDPDAGGSSEPMSAKSFAVPGWAATGVGAAGLVAGVIGTVQVNSFNSEAESMVCGGSLCANASTARANKLQDDMDSAYTMSVIGYSVAAIGLATGGYLLYRAYGGEPEAQPDASDEESLSPSVSFGVAPSSDGASFGLQLDF